MNLTEGQLLFRLQDFHGAEQEALGIGDYEFAQESADIACALRELLQARRTIEELTAVVGQRNGECVRLHSLLEAAEKRIAELEARTVSVKLPDGWHFEECETEGCQNCALFSMGKAANNLHLCEACAKAPLNSRFTKTVLPKRLPFKLTAGIKLEVGE
ncbi:hypothetical protein [Citrobacter freundii]|uniref:hypothetical protein n=1 Tax=Citrobacter freundii TaxID=546 RepID=UPI001A93CE93|nr:hypothetical protein [Citrobacter freundii]MBO0957299.1 hypothetical protein [Citrobacter freundii]